MWWNNATNHALSPSVYLETAIAPLIAILRTVTYLLSNSLPTTTKLKGDHYWEIPTFL